MSGQVGGDHYQPDRCGGIEPFTVIDAWGLNFYEGNALKYLARKTKGTDRAEDLRKASHYLAEAADREAEDESAVEPEFVFESPTDAQVRAEVEAARIPAGQFEYPDPNRHAYGWGRQFVRLDDAFNGTVATTRSGRSIYFSDRQWDLAERGGYIRFSRRT